MAYSKYISYGIEPRKDSSNVIVGLYIEDKKHKTEIILIPTLEKTKGDIIADQVCRLLNEQNKIGKYIESGGY